MSIPNTSLILSSSYRSKALHFVRWSKCKPWVFGEGHEAEINTSTSGASRRSSSCWRRQEPTEDFFSPPPPPGYCGKERGWKGGLRPPSPRRGGRRIPDPPLLVMGEKSEGRGGGGGPPYHRWCLDTVPCKPAPPQPSSLGDKVSQERKEGRDVTGPPPNRGGDWAGGGWE